MNFYNKFVVLFIALLVGNATLGVAQLLKVEDFEKLPKPLLKPTPGRDKAGAVINFMASEGGYQFKVAGQTVPANQTDDAISITVPKKSSYVEISHPSYGTIYWKPTLKLKKKRVYQAVLGSDLPKSEYKISKQWAVLTINPSDAIVQVDTMLSKVRDGQLQLYLPVGEHLIEITAPFYETIYDTLSVADDGVLRVAYNLSPIYSYLEVVTSDGDATLSINGRSLSRGQFRSARLLAGSYTLELSAPKYQSQSVQIELADRERKVVQMPPLVKLSKGAKTGKDTITEQEQTESSEQTQELEARQITKTKVSLVAFDEDCEVLINRESVGKGEWSGELSEGDYYFMSRRGELESRIIYAKVGGVSPMKFELPTPMAYYAKMNVACNVAGASIFLNGELVGESPLIVQNLKADVLYQVELRKGGYRTQSKKVRLKGNALTAVEFKLKQKIK